MTRHDASAFTCPIHGTSPSDLCHVQQAAPPIRPITIPEEQQRANFVSGLVITLAALVIALGAWVALFAWLLG